MVLFHKIAFSLFVHTLYRVVPFTLPLECRNHAQLRIVLRVKVSDAERGDSFTAALMCLRRKEAAAEANQHPYEWITQRYRAGMCRSDDVYSLVCCMN